MSDEITFCSERDHLTVLPDCDKANDCGGDTEDDGTDKFVCHCSAEVLIIRVEMTTMRTEIEERDLEQSVY